MKLIFIRHGKTWGNIEKRYIGKTDESLCDIGKNELADKEYPDCEVVISSNMKRCIQTAEIIYPDKNIIIYDDFRECDFGDFEGKNYFELKDDYNYRNWIDSSGILRFPGGENPMEFKNRCIFTFRKAVSDHNRHSVIAFIVHGGTIMSILEKYAVPGKNYFDYQISNAGGFITEFDGKQIIIMEKI